MRKKDELLDAIGGTLIRRERIFVPREVILQYAENFAAKMQRPTGDAPATVVDALAAIISNEKYYQGLVTCLEKKWKEIYA